jgi:hypothetical protein
MTIEACLYNELASAAGVAALVETRIVPQFAPDFPEDQTLATVKPHLVYALRDAQVQNAMAFQKISEVFDVLCCANNFDAMLALAEAVVVALHGRKGLFGGVGGLEIQGCFLTEYSDQSSYDLGLFARRLTFAVDRIRT